jgi:lipooligosaccharide transport system permease protein
LSLTSNISRRSWAVWQRNKDVFFKTWKTNFLPPFLEPILYLLAMGFGFGMLIHELPAPWDVIAGEILWGATKSFINATIVALVVAAFGLLSFPDFLVVIPLTFLVGLMFGAIAMIFTAVVPNIDSFNYPFFLFITPMFLFSGTFFPLEILPKVVQDIALFLPLTHATILMRGFGLGVYGSIDIVSIVYLLILTLITFYAAVWMMRRRLVN